MANIPGINGYVQAGVFARDRVNSTGASTPGGLRIPCLLGEGKREEIIITSALGSGLDGNAACSPSGVSGLSKFFQLQNFPVIKGKTELFVNGLPLYGTEGAVDGTPFDGKFGFRIDPVTGCIELQGASIVDQNGKQYSQGPLNVGNGILASGLCGTLSLLDILAVNTPNERWSVRCVSVLRDANGDPVPGRATFSVTGSVTGQLLNAAGQPSLFSSGYSEGFAGAVSGNIDPCLDGFAVASSVDFAVGNAVIKAGNPTHTDTFVFVGDLIAQGQALIGDDLCLAGVSHEIIAITYDAVLNETTILTAADTILNTLTASAWDVKAIAVFIDDPAVVHNGVTGLPITVGRFTGRDIGKVLQICTGASTGRYLIEQVTSSRRVRVSSLDNPGFGFPSIADANADGLGELGLTFNILETNGVLLLGIKEGTAAFAVGDLFFVDVASNILTKGDSLSAKYIAELDLETPTYFTSSKQLYAKHGLPSLSNPLSLGAQIAFENGAAGMFAVQCRPSIPKRTSQVLLPEIDGQGLGGFPNYGGIVTNLQADDLTFILPLPLSGLSNAAPGLNTQVNFFRIRNGLETQIFPNKIPFYNTQLETATGQTLFISDTNNPYSYTVIKSGLKIIGQGISGALSLSSKTFFSTELNFDGSHVGSTIVVQSGIDSAGVTHVTSAAVSTVMFGALATTSHELIITAVIDDNTVSVQSAAISADVVIGNLSGMHFFVKDPADTVNISSSILMHRDLAGSGTFLAGDGIRVSYIDETDVSYYDPNWFASLQSIEAIDCQIVVPLPLNGFSSIFRAADKHAVDMSSIAIQKERVMLFGAQKGLTPNALLGNSLLAIEDVGILEGIQGDNPAEVLSGNVEDLINYKLSDNFTSNRSCFFYPDEIVRNVSGTNVLIDGFFIAAAAAGELNRNQNISVPLTRKVLTGFSIPNSKLYRRTTLDQLGGVGATVLQPVLGGGRILTSRTTSQSGLIEDEELSIMFIRDAVKDISRKSLANFIGTAETANTASLMQQKIITMLSGLESKGTITGYKNVRIEKDLVDPRQWNVYFAFAPAYPINYVFIDIEVGVI